MFLFHRFIDLFADYLQIQNIFKMFFQLRLHLKSVFKSEFLCCHVSSMKWHPTIPPSASRESTIIAFFFRNGALSTAVTSGQFPYNATPANWKGPLKISKTYMCVCVCAHAYIYICLSQGKLQVWVSSQSKFNRFTSIPGTTAISTVGLSTN